MHIFGGIIKILKPTNKSVWLKMKPTQEVTNIAGQLPTYCLKGTNKLGQLPTYPGTLDLFSSSNIYFWRNYYNSQTHKQQLLVEIEAN